ncbi:glycosyltransferase [Pectobacterium polaris]|uniref:Glycosyltransferase n=2 Tax=Pectobacterium polaris TaxID=2042057 RepID=A0AAW4NYB5_9GAMM|nr:glycosyltransferase [Pectobacterium polaris]MBW5892074.1 glycosyltransferase [Pectobacterium polaris]MCA6942750.1 glycosyltransferase [Pectobacterium polaris]
MVKVKLISFSLSKGGAAIAAKKFGHLLLKNGVGVDFINQDNAGRWSFFKRVISFILVKMQFDNNPIKHSLNFFSYKPVIDSFNYANDIHHFHWINNDTLSVFDFDKIPKDSILTLHDEWLYCGVEHYVKVDPDCKNSNEGLDLDFINGYKFFKKGLKGVNWSFYIWKIKKRILSKRKDIIYTVPSLWMLDRAKKSQILKDADIRLLPNPIDIDVFKPLSALERNEFRHKMGFSEDDFLIVFGAIGGNKNPIKGGKQLEESLNNLKSLMSDSDRQRIRLIIFGSAEKSSETFSGFSCSRVGHIADPTALSALYSAADCAVIPSLVESFGQVAAEALASETPVVCFETSGLKDIVINGRTGFTVEPFDTYAFANAIKDMFFLSTEERKSMARLGRNFVVENFSYSIISENYFSLINEVNSKKLNNLVK